MTPDAYRGHLAMFVFSALVGGTFALGVFAANEVAPLALNALRFWIAAGIIGICVAVTGAPLRPALASPWRYVLLAALFTAYFVLMFEGLKTAPAVSAAAVFTLTPILTAFFGWILLRQILHPRMATALVIGGVGAIWVIFDADINAIKQFDIGRGEFIYFWGCVSHGIYTPLARMLNRGETALVYTFGVLLTGAVLLTIVGWGDIMATDWAALAPIVWVTILYLAVVGSAVTFTLLQFATMRLPGSKVLAYTYLIPSWVIVWNFAIGRGSPPLAVGAGVALTVVALLLLLRDDD